MPPKKRRRVASAGKTGKRKGKSAATEAEAAAGDVNVPSEDEISSEDAARAAPPSDNEDEFFETADEKKVRLAKEYLGRLGTDKSKEEVQEQLNKDAEDQAKRSRIQVDDVVLGQPKLLRGHKMAVTSVCLSSDERTAYSGGKDCHVIRWDVETGKKDMLPGGRNRFECGGHFAQVLGVCLAESRGLLVSCGADRLVRLWDPRTPAGGACKTGLLDLAHSGAVTGVAAEEDGSQLYSVSLDKSLKIWDLRTLRCSDTLFGHVDGVVSIDLYNKGRPLTGGLDKTVRLWKVDKETHLMFNRHIYSVDAVTVADQDRFLSGSQDGSLMLWSSASKKPLASASLGSSRWVTALRAVRSGNVAFSGGVDGQLRCWRFARPPAAPGGAAGEEGRALKLAEVAPPLAVPGCVNAIAAGKKVLVCAVAKEHRLGRWYYERRHKNGVLIVPLSYRET